MLRTRKDLLRHKTRRSAFLSKRELTSFASKLRNATRTQNCEK